MFSDYYTYKKGDKLYSARIAVHTDKLVNDLKVHHAGGLVTIDSDLPDTENNFPTYHNIKLVVDVSLDTPKYVSLTLGETTYDISQYSLIESSPVSRDYFEVKINWYDTSGSKTPLYIDDFILKVEKSSVATPT